MSVISGNGNDHVALSRFGELLFQNGPLVCVQIVAEDFSNFGIVIAPSDYDVSVLGGNCGTDDVGYFSGAGRYCLGARTPGHVSQVQDVS